MHAPHTCLGGGVIHAETFTADNKTELTVSATEDAGPADNTDQYYLTVNKGTNMQSVTGEGWYDKGTTVTATGTPKAAYTDSGTNYTVDPSDSGHRYFTKHTFTATPVEKIMNSAQSATVNATETKTNGGGDQYYLTVTKGTNMQSVTGAGWYNKGATATASGTANSNYTESSFTSGGTGYQYKKTHTYTVNTQKPVMSSAKSVTIAATDTTGKANEQYYLTVNKDSGVNTATASQWVNKGGSVSVTATAKSGYAITGGTGSTGAINAAKTVNVTSAQVYTVTWSAPLSQYGSYLGTTTSGSSSNAGSKVIIYTNTSGVTSYANPYKAGSITIKAGTAVTIQMVSGSYDSGVKWIVGSSNVDHQHVGSYALVSSSYTPTTSGALSISHDNYSSYYDNYSWYVKFS